MVAKFAISWDRLTQGKYAGWKAPEARLGLPGSAIAELALASAER